MKRIQKIANFAGLVGKVLNAFSNSKNDSYSCDYINQLHNYSTEEQVIGIWDDGKTKKPYYRRKFEVPEKVLDTTKTTVISFEIGNDAIIKYAIGFINTETSQYGCPLSYNGIGKGFQLRTINGGTMVQILASTDVSAEKKITSGNVEVYYTKTTD